MTSYIFKLVEIINIVYYVTMFVDIGAKRNIAQCKLINIFFLSFPLL